MSGDLDTIEAELEPEPQEDIETPLEIDDSLKGQLAEYGKEKYLEPEASGMDRFHDKAAQALEELDLGEYKNDCLQYLADLPVEVGKGIAQGAAGSVSAPGAIYDGIQEWRQDDYDHSISFADQIERYSDGKTIPRYLGEAAGYTAGAAMIFTSPEIATAGAAQNARHLGERKIHEKARNSFYNPENSAS